MLFFYGHFRAVAFDVSSYPSCFLFRLQFLAHCYFFSFNLLLVKKESTANVVAALFLLAPRLCFFLLPIFVITFLDSSAFSFHSFEEKRKKKFEYFLDFSLLITINFVTVVWKLLMDDCGGQWNWIIQILFFSVERIENTLQISFSITIQQQQQQQNFWLLLKQLKSDNEVIWFEINASKIGRREERLKWKKKNQNFFLFFLLLSRFAFSVLSKLLKGKIFFVLSLFSS